MKAISLCFSLSSFLILCCASHAAPRSGSTTWGQWSFNWNVGSNKEGLEISNVHFKGVKVIHKASMPVVRVKYGRPLFDGSGCGPYADRMKWDNMVLTSCQNEKICQREWDDELLELGAFSKIGEYDLYQAWYFAKSGRIEAALFSSGWSCEETHRHHPYWRIDFDVDGVNNEVYRFRKSAPNLLFPDEWLEYRIERNEAQPRLNSSIGWWIANATSRQYVILRPLQTMLSDLFSSKDAGIRRYRGSEDVGWTVGGLARLPFGNSEFVWQRDSVFWYVAHLHHDWVEGMPHEDQDRHWHWVGPIIYMGW